MTQIVEVIFDIRQSPGVEEAQSRGLLEDSGSYLEKTFLIIYKQTALI